MNAFLSLFGIVLTIQCHARVVLADVTASIKTAATWPGGGQYYVQLKNNDGSKTVCSAKFLLIPKSGSSISGKWGMYEISGAAANNYQIIQLHIAPGATNDQGGMNVKGDGVPDVKLLEAQYYENGFCGGGGGSCNGCLSNTNTPGPINDILDQPISNSIFTFYGFLSGGGACGLDIGVPQMSAAASDQLFSKSSQWKDACRQDGNYMLDDPICKNICVKIDYKNKSLTVPINNQCPGCPKNHVDLSTPAFLFLEPDARVGRARDATLTYMKCPANIKQC